MLPDSISWPAGPRYVGDVNRASVVTVPVDDRERHVIPRWHRSATAAARKELGSAIRPPDRVLESNELALLEDKRLDWEGHQSLSYATDFVGTALLVGEPLMARDAASFILGRSLQTPEGARLLAARALAPDGPVVLAGEISGHEVEPAVRANRRIRTLRASLGRGPRNPLAWADIAYEYALLGRADKALKAMTCALQIAPDSRFLLRAAARFYTHFHDPERALQLLRHAAGGAEDPWIAAAETAVAAVAGRSPRLAVAGSRLLVSGRFPPSQLTELASALGTLEVAAGKRRVGKRLFEQSLVEPTENAVAQAEWASRHLGVGVTLLPRHFETPGSFEARARERLAVGAFDAALAEGQRWLGDQAFSRDPASFSSYVASVPLEDFVEAVRILRLGLVANPKDWLLLNNLAFAEASLGNVGAAREALAGISPQPTDRLQLAVLTATEGLLAFREGQSALGRRLYLQAIQAFTKGQFTQGAALATLFLTREETIAGSAPEVIAESLERARRLVKKVGSADVLAVAASLERLASSKNTQG
jgi:tetratricopeptide (TPR) repeat protein